ncbi:hypothetical protein B0H17DRAFT_934508 [Mycena rosella]|uniref:Uncharacterized protein n=1 Tax=Mycena rosella TaxID=1033263 RepID=A0AAD7DI72_MYCRO|nr:hypothetical protein B0H17DRAFT_934508 [Mycena rosella]
MNERDGRASKKRKLNVEARLLTSVDSRRLAAEKETERLAKEVKKAALSLCRKEKENARDNQRRTRDSNQPFTGLLTAKNKGDLVDIAWDLKIPEDGTKAVLCECINTFFRAHPDLRGSTKYSGLFVCGRRTGAHLLPLLHPLLPLLS